MKKTIAIDCRMISMSGIGTYIKHILPGIISSDYFNVICLGYEDLKSFEWYSLVTHILLKSKILSIQEQFELYKKVPACDIYWSPNWNVPFFKIKAFKRIVTIHDVYHLANASNFSRLKIALMMVYMGFIKKKSLPIITVSNFSKKEIVKYTGIAEDKITVIALGIDNNYTTKIVESGRQVEGPYFLYVGNVKPHKNISIVLEAMRLIKDKEIKFVVVGQKDGFITNDNSLADLVNELGSRVVFTGKVSDNDLKSYYKNARFFVFPSKYEGFGIPILEAMQFKLPIIASNCASIPEVGGDKLIYFDPLSANDLTDKINKLLDGDIVLKMDTYSQQLEKFDWEKTKATHIQTFKDILF